MATSTSTYNSRNRIADIYPKYKDLKFFDLHQKHFLYGRIDRQGNAIQLNDGSLTETSHGTRTEFMIDFVKDAFLFLKNDIDRFLRGSHIARKSKYNPTRLQIRKAWRSGDLEYRYYHHLNSLYADFVQEYLEKERRYEQIVDFDDFLSVFSKYLARIAYRFPVTKTGYVLSHHCSPYVSGLMFSVTEDKHGIAFDRVKEEFINDPNFETFARAARRVGLMIDRNAPWRFVFNLASGGTRPNLSIGKMTFDENGMSKGITGQTQLAEDVRTGGAFFMNNYGVNFDNVFDSYYTKTHLNEIDNLRNYMFMFYSAFYTQFRSFSKLETYQCQSALEFNTRLRVKYVNRKELPGLEPSAAGTLISVPEDFDKVYRDDFWLRYILKFRLLETKNGNDNQLFIRHEREMMNHYNAFGTTAALNYINDLTKGFFETKFITEGKYWYGQQKSAVDTRKKQAYSDSIVSDDSYQLTGVLNKVE